MFVDAHASGTPAMTIAYRRNSLKCRGACGACGEYMALLRVVCRSAHNSRYFALLTVCRYVYRVTPMSAVPPRLVVQDARRPYSQMRTTSAQPRSVLRRCQQVTRGKSNALTSFAPAFSHLPPLFHPAGPRRHGNQTTANEVFIPFTRPAA